MGQNDVMLSCEKTFNELFTLETIITYTRDKCIDKDANFCYTELPDNLKKGISEERNQYISMMSLALNCITSLRNINSDIEQDHPRL